MSLPSAQVRRIESDLSSGQPDRLRRAIELPPGQRLDRQFVEQLHGVRIQFEPATAVSHGKDQVQVRATVTSSTGAAQEWEVILDHLHGRYVIASTKVVPS